MKKLAVLMMVMAIATVGMVGSAKAADLYLGGKIPIAIPLPNFDSIAGVGGGIVAEADYFVMPGLAVTGEFGFIYHGEKNIAQVTQLPLMVGVRYEFLEGPLKPFAHLRMGLNFVRTAVTFSAFGISTSTSNTDTNFAMDFGGGVLYSVIENLDIGGSLEFGFAGLNSNSSDSMHFIINIMALYGLM